MKLNGIYFVEKYIFFFHENFYEKFDFLSKQFDFNNELQEFFPLLGSGLL